MKEFWQRFGGVITAVFWFALGLTFVVLLGKAKQAQGNTLCRSIEVVVSYEEGNFFINEKDIKELIKGRLPSRSFNVPINMIDLADLEGYLESNPYIYNAEVFIDIKGKMWVAVNQRRPLARVVNAENTSYYISENGHKMPISSQFSSRVPIVSGYIEDNNRTEGKLYSKIIKDIYRLTNTISQDEFLSSLIEQIYVETNRDFVLIPKIGNHRIILGNIENLERKFHKLMVFYEEGVPNVGWQKYKTINLKFENQIICTQK